MASGIFKGTRELRRTAGYRFRFLAGGVGCCVTARAYYRVRVCGAVFKVMSVTSTSEKQGSFRLERDLT